MAPDDARSEAYALPYYSWMTNFEHVILTELFADVGEPTAQDTVKADEPEEPEGILLHTLAPVEVDDAGAEPSMRSRKLPAAVADVAAPHRSATDLLEQVFVSIFPANMTAVVVYVTPRAYDRDGGADLLDLFSVAVLSGRPNYSGRRVLFEGGVLLEDLVAGNPQELREVHEGLHSRVNRYLWRAKKPERPGGDR